jgi:hypothetical protein
LIAKKANSEAFIANYEAEEKMKQAEKSLQDEKVAEKKLMIAKLEADVKEFKNEEEKAAKQVEEKIKKETGTIVTKTTVEEDPRMKKFEEGLAEDAKKEEEKEEKLEAKEKKLAANENPGIKASKLAEAAFDEAEDKYKEERTLMEKVKAEEEAKALAL